MENNGVHIASLTVGSTCRKKSPCSSVSPLWFSVIQKKGITQRDTEEALRFTEFLKNMCNNHIEKFFIINN